MPTGSDSLPEAKLSAVCSLEVLRSPRALKRSALLFDRIFVSTLGMHVSMLDRAGELGARVSAELQWLVDEGILQEMPIPISSAGFAPGPDLKMLLEVGRAAYPADEYPSVSAVWSTTREFDRGFGHSNNLVEAASRLQKQDGKSVVALYDRRMEPTITVATGKTSVARVIIEALPEPPEDTPWQSIQEFRKDPDAQRKHIAIRGWMGRVAKENLDDADLNVNRPGITGGSHL